MQLVLDKSGFQHICERHLLTYYNGTKVGITTFWPSSTTASRLAKYAKEAMSKINPSNLTGGFSKHAVLLDDGIEAMVFVEGNVVKSIFPTAGKGVVKAVDILDALKQNTIEYTILSKMKGF